MPLSQMCPGQSGPTNARMHGCTGYVDNMAAWEELLQPFDTLEDYYGPDLNSTVDDKPLAGRDMGEPWAAIINSLSLVMSATHLHRLGRSLLLLAGHKSAALCSPSAQVTARRLTPSQGGDL